jgi:hypothetical protein|tara:strand:+ start:210 stop:323 length:114 start_codon:yes stop_codon:yes gene_type:complete
LSENDSEEPSGSGKDEEDDQEEVSGSDPELSEVDEEE